MGVGLAKAVAEEFQVGMNTYVGLEVPDGEADTRSDEGEIEEEVLALALELSCEEASAELVGALEKLVVEEAEGDTLREERVVAVRAKLEEAEGDLLSLGEKEGEEDMEEEGVKDLDTLGDNEERGDTVAPDPLGGGVVEGNQGVGVLTEEALASVMGEGEAALDSVAAEPGLTVAAEGEGVREATVLPEGKEEGERVGRSGDGVSK